MSKPRTEGEFSQQIIEDRNWRIREISDLKAAVNNADSNLRRVLLRALVTICYAHWEGYVRFAARKYMEHISLRKFQYIELDRQFYRNYFLPRLAALSVTKSSITDRCHLIDEILGASENRYSRVNDDLINTKSNLNSDVLRDICLICGVPPLSFDDKETFIDVVLLKRRNAIAHGEETLIDFKELEFVTSETIGLIRSFGDSLENYVVLKTYKAA